MSFPIRTWSEIESLAATDQIIKAILAQRDRDHTIKPLHLLAEMVVQLSVANSQLARQLRHHQHEIKAPVLPDNIMQPVSYWKFVGLFLAGHPELVEALLQYAQQTPDRHLGNRLGELYMLRYWLVKGSIRIHHIMRADEDRHPHNHPWEFRTFILRGWYVEEKLTPTGEVYSEKHCAGESAIVFHGDYHRITEVSPGGVLTMCLLGERQSRWGFLQDGLHVDSHAYLNYPDGVTS